jgi:hypothetical protein
LLSAIVVGVAGAGDVCAGLAFLSPLAGMAGGIVVQIAAARRNEQRRNAWLTEGKEIAPP